MRGHQDRPQRQPPRVPAFLLYALPHSHRSHIVGDLSEEPAEPAAPPDESATTEPAESFDESVHMFVEALESKNPQDFLPLIGDSVLAGEPYSEGEYFSSDEFVGILGAEDSPYAHALYSNERVSSFINGYNAGTLEKGEWGDGGYSLSTADYMWYVAFAPAADRKWYLTVCAVASFG
ncbi:MAG: hypothetical protein JSW52_01195 [Candidatus Coatesbacteria bacterium]|nr:MAG: hypothetical protein JSW52_01195 [Candidatus Coatesbacteria bacterium]